MVSLLEKTYAKDDIIAEMDNEIACFTKSATISLLRFANAL